jgi:hypothetical protein
MANFYVYEHWRLDRDECFYVGKGKGGRAYRMRDRNSHHQAIMAKLSREGSGMEVRMVKTGLTEGEAFSLEIERISFWRGIGVDLANHTNGGDGVSGLKMSNESKAKMSAAKKGMVGNITMLGRKHSEETKAKMSDVHKGVKKSSEHAAKVGLRHKGKTFVVSQETKNKISISHLGKKHSAASIEKMKKSWIARKEKSKEAQL